MIAESSFKVDDDKEFVKKEQGNEITSSKDEQRSMSEGGNEGNTTIPTNPEIPSKEILIAEVKKLLVQNSQVEDSDRNQNIMEMCKYVLEGKTCPYDPLCTYAHTYGKLKPKLARADHFKIRICSQFRYSMCRYNSRCQFIHDEVVYELTDHLRIYFSKNDRMYRIVRDTTDNKVAILNIKLPKAVLNDPVLVKYLQIFSALDSFFVAKNPEVKVSAKTRRSFECTHVSKPTKMETSVKEPIIPKIEPGTPTPNWYSYNQIVAITSFVGQKRGDRIIKGQTFIAGYKDTADGCYLTRNDGHVIKLLSTEYSYFEIYKPTENDQSSLYAAPELKDNLELIDTLLSITYQQKKENEKLTEALVSLQDQFVKYIGTIPSPRQMNLCNNPSPLLPSPLPAASPSLQNLQHIEYLNAHSPSMASEFIAAQANNIRQSPTGITMPPRTRPLSIQALQPLTPRQVQQLGTLSPQLTVPVFTPLNMPHSMNNAENIAPENSKYDRQNVVDEKNNGTVYNKSKYSQASPLKKRKLNCALGTLTDSNRNKKQRTNKMINVT